MSIGFNKKDYLFLSKEECDNNLEYDDTKVVDWTHRVDKYSDVNIVLQNLYYETKKLYPGLLDNCDMFDFIEFFK